MVATLLELGADIHATRNVSVQWRAQAAELPHWSPSTHRSWSYCRVPLLQKTDDTPLHFAAAVGHPGVVHRLLAAGADPQALNRQG